MVLKGKINDICEKLRKLSSECEKVGINDLNEFEHICKECVDYERLKK